MGQSFGVLLSNDSALPAGTELCLRRLAATRTSPRTQIHWRGRAPGIPQGDSLVKILVIDHPKLWIKWSGRIVSIRGVIPNLDFDIRVLETLARTVAKT